MTWRSYGLGVAVPLLLTEPDAAGRAARDARARTRRRFLMCPPDHFEVVYSINPWMDPSVPVDRRRAARQWERLVATYCDLGHQVELVPPVAGAPDMVFSANSAIVVDGRVLAARFRRPERAPEQDPYRRWFAARGYTDVRAARTFSEGEGDFAVTAELMLGGWGIRSSRGAHVEAQEFFGVPVVSLRLIDARFYHLDLALCVLDEHTVAYYPGAFSGGSRRVLRRLFPGGIEVGECDALALGLNAVSDGYHVVLPSTARAFADRLRARGYEPVPVDVSEFHKAGGAVKCCTLELRGRSAR
jgi:N-dimethylarginine dimethylaminohydrolase